MILLLTVNHLFPFCMSHYLVLLIKSFNSYRLYLCSRLFEESPAWFSFHLFAMIQACTHHSAVIVKSQQWPTPSESIAIYCARKVVSCVTHLSSCAWPDIWNKKKNYLVLQRSKLKIETTEPNWNPSTKHSLFKKTDCNGHSAHWLTKLLSAFQRRAVLCCKARACNCCFR